MPTLSVIFLCYADTVALARIIETVRLLIDLPDMKLPAAFYGTYQGIIRDIALQIYLCKILAESNLIDTVSLLQCCS